MSTVIRVENLGKKYTLQHQQREQYTALRDVITNGFAYFGKKIIKPFNRSLNSQPSSLNGLTEDFWALKDVSFEVKQGDRIGIIGRNGAGKSTLLKILSRITEPTTGSVRIKGRVASLLEVGTGFHPELTGRENIYLNGAILGMGRTEIKKKFDEIVDFAEIDKFLDTPVKRYSSGMYVRLAFAVAAHLEPEILIVDEVLAVGDAQFQKKCLGKMEDVSAREGRTVLFVSHNMAAIKALCKNGIYLEKGKICYTGDVSNTTDAYLSAGISESAPFISFEDDPKLPIQLLSVKVVNEDGELASHHPYDETYFLNIRINVRTRMSNIYLAAHVHDAELQTIIFSRDFELSQNCLLEREPGIYSYRIKIPTPLLVPGTYRVSVHIACSSPAHILNGVDLVCPFELIDNGSMYAKSGFPWRGKISIPLKWDII